MAELSEKLTRRRALEDRKDKIATDAMDLFTLSKDLWPTPTQLQGLRAAAASTDSVEEVKIFIQYQVGREQIKKPFGDKLIDHIKSWESETNGDMKLYIEIVRQFLGNAVRYRKYMEYRDNDKQDSKQAKDVGETQ